MWKKTSEKKALAGGCLLNPQSKLLPQANASIISKGKFLLVIVGTSVQIIKCEIAKIKNTLFIFLFKTFIINYLQ
jgi:hypothetical protein